MKWMLLLLVACTSAPPVKNFAYEEIRHKECLRPVENLSISFPMKIQNALIQTTGTAGSLLVTSAGVVSDTVVVSTGVAGVALCGYGNGTGAGCGELAGGYFALMDEMGLIWTTKRAFKGTASWRCPEVDHISRAWRKVSECLYQNGEYIAAFEQISLLKADDVMSECASAKEWSRLNELETKLSRNSAETF